jgi:copper chaperone CopZ
VRVAFKNINGIESVDVSLNKGVATVVLKDGNTVTMKQLRDAISKNGFSTKESIVVAIGQLNFTNGAWSLRVTGANEDYALTPEQGNQPLATSLAGKTVTVTGTIVAVPNGKLPTEIRVSTITEK